MDAVSLFSGLGGLDWAAVRSGIDVVMANEVDHNACLAYRHNFPNHNLVEGDIRGLDPGTLPKFDLLMAGFPCQSFSIAGHRKGFDDDRGLMFFEIMRVVDHARPRWMLLENVANLESHDGGRTWKRIRKEIASRGYHMKHGILDSKDFGLAQHRERIFMACSLHDLSDFDFPWPIPGRKPPKIGDFVDFDGGVDDSYCLSPKSRYFPLFKKVKRGEAWQLRRYYARKSKSGLCPTLTANMGSGGHNVPFIRGSAGIRKLTEHECLKLQGLDGMSWPDGMARCHRYRQVGNSVSAPVVEALLGRILHEDRRLGGGPGAGDGLRQEAHGTEASARPNWDPDYWGH